MHGDSLCTDDIGYMRFRRIVRNPTIQKLFLSLPSRWRRGLAQKLRANSKSSAATKPMMIMDVTPDAVSQVMDQYRVKTLIHGHTHRAAVHDLGNGLSDNPGEHLQRIVLGDWDKFGWCLEHNNDRPNGQAFALNKFLILNNSQN